MVKRYNQNLSIVSGISKSETKSSATGGESVDNIDVVLSGKGFFSTARFDFNTIYCKILKNVYFQ